jgi:4-hydroxy-tetrahydrodipicolinate synthase
LLDRNVLIDSAEMRLPMVDVSTELAARLDAEIAQRTPAMLHRV